MRLHIGLKIWLVSTDHCNGQTLCASNSAVTLPTHLVDFVCARAATGDWSVGYTIGSAGGIAGSSAAGRLAEAHGVSYVVRAIALSAGLEGKVGEAVFPGHTSAGSHGATVA